jgi:4-amino-4-deoxy-L-arabinose transferase-like glycosyltransferase
LTGHPFEHRDTRGFLAAVFWCFGVGPYQVLWAQHALGCATAVLICLGVTRLRGPVAGAVWGVVCGLDPVLLAYESMALTEGLATFLFVWVAWLALGQTRHALWRPAVGGLLLGLLCLVRPAFQVAAPFVGGRVRAGSGRGSCGPCIARASSACFVACFLVAVGPWLYHNSSRGNSGLSASQGVYLWIGTCQSGLLDANYPLPDAIGPTYQRVLAPDPRNESRIHRFLGAVNGWRDPLAQQTLTRWALSSIAARPVAYARAMGHAACWQLGYFPRASDAQFNEVRWAVWRIGRDGRTMGMKAPNFQFDQPFSDGGAVCGA